MKPTKSELRKARILEAIYLASLLAINVLIILFA